MSRSYRCIIFAIAGLILLGTDNPSQNPSSNATAAQTDQKSRQHEDISLGVSRIGDALEAQNSKTDPYEKERNEREIRDLQAQENSAYWAEAMFWATISALVLSAIGVGLVYTTFDQARKATAIAQENLDLYRKAEAGSLTPTVKWLDDGRLHVVATYRGSGTCEIIMSDLGYFECNDASIITLPTKLSSNFFDLHRSIDESHPYAFPPIDFPENPVWTVGGGVIWKDRFGGINLCGVALDVIPSTQTIYSSGRLNFSRWRAAIDDFKNGKSITREP
jgi:hypothetical protein